jgi:hypothetical protein
VQKLVQTQNREFVAKTKVNKTNDSPIKNKTEYGLGARL